MKSRRYLLLATAVAATLSISGAWAADAATAASSGDTDAALDTVIVTGTRQSGIKAIDSPAPIQIITGDDLERAAASPNLIQTLAALVPSFNAEAFGSDLSNLTLEAQLRGLSPNDTLILVNGKRRHTTSNLSIGGGNFEGGAGVDLNFIPVDVIDHIEVLTDGAAAQYGSDAIAGVINVVLKKNASGGNLQGEYGAYEDGGGVTHDISGNVGFEPYAGAFLNITAEWRDHGHSDRGAVDPRVIDPVGFPNTDELTAPGYPYLNKIEGDAQQQLKIASLNSGFDLGSDAQFYAFGSYGDKNAASFENYRTPSTVSYSNPATGAVTYQFPYGFSPLEAIEEIDYQVNGGIKGVRSGWNWDLASGYGSDSMNLWTTDSTNLSLYALDGTSPPAGFYDGSFKATQWSGTLDINRDFETGFSGPLNVAFGGEYRRETYGIGAGIPASYYGAGAASFPGFNPADAGSHSRTDYAGYLDLASKVMGQLRVDVAGRFEHYSDFGTKTIGKLTARYDFSAAAALQGTVSTGFRAPTLAEEYYTTTNVSPTSATVQLAPDSVGAKDLGLGSGLQPETATNYSLGFVFSPVTSLTGSVDAYYITLENRIIPSGTLSAALNGVVVAPAITQAIIDNGNSLDPQVVATGQTAVNLFTNGVNTHTRGADFTLDYASDLDRLGRVVWSIAANYSSTSAYDIRSGSTQLNGQPLFDQTAISYLTTAAPRYKLNLGAFWTIGRLSINLHEVIYGPSSEYSQDGGLTDLVENILPPHVIYYRDVIGVTPITNVNVSYDVLRSVKLSVGAVNLFNRYPNKINSELLTLFNNPAVLSNSGVAQYPNFSPIGFDGSYYYLRVSYTF